ncbi:MAG: hypothetical protein IJ466_02305 [Clostridia bacterium]|nr:hypothetical protein [Clostridia bacterium]
MSSIVCKFGGSSVCDAGMFLRVKEILLACPERKYIVLSAPGKRTMDDEKITDLLYRAYEAGCAGDQFIFAQIFQRYASIRDRLAPKFDLEAEFASIRRNSRISADFAVSRGEYLCAKLFAAFMDLPFVDAADLFIFGDNGIDYEETRRRIQEKLLPLGRAVVPGFYGSTRDCGVRTFTRGGSDVSGALLAAALDADCYENWTDVDGLFSADPNIVPEAARHSCVGLTQMERIARAGAKLLHPDALIPLKGTGIQTIIKNTHAPDAPGTAICEFYLPTVPCVTGITGLYMMESPGGASSDILLHPTPISGARRVDAISAFGMPDEALDAVKASVNPIHIIHMQDHKQIIIEEGRYAESVRKIHSILMLDNII